METRLQSVEKQVDGEDVEPIMQMAPWVTGEQSTVVWKDGFLQIVNVWMFLGHWEGASRKEKFEDKKEEENDVWVQIPGGYRSDVCMGLWEAEAQTTIRGIGIGRGGKEEEMLEKYFEVWS